MTDGHSCQLSQRSVVGIGVAKIEVKGADGSIRMKLRQHRGRRGTRQRVSRPGRGCKYSALEDWRQPQGCCWSWLCILRGKRNGRHDGASGCGHEEVARHRRCSEDRTNCRSPPTRKVCGSLFSTAVFDLLAEEEASRSRACPSCFLSHYTSTSRAIKSSDTEQVQMFNTSTSQAEGVK